MAPGTVSVSPFNYLSYTSRYLPIQEHATCLSLAQFLVLGLKLVVRSIIALYVDINPLTIRYIYVAYSFKKDKNLYI